MWVCVWQWEKGAQERECEQKEKEDAGEGARTSQSAQDRERGRGENLLCHVEVSEVLPLVSAPIRICVPHIYGRWMVEHFPWVWRLHTCNVSTFTLVRNSLSTETPSKSMDQKGEHQWKSIWKKEEIHALYTHLGKKGHACKRCTMQHTTSKKRSREVAEAGKSDKARQLVPGPSLPSNHHSGSSSAAKLCEEKRKSSYVTQTHDWSSAYKHKDTTDQVHRLAHEHTHKSSSPSTFPSMCVCVCFYVCSFRTGQAPWLGRHPSCSGEAQLAQLWP